ncbi:MAG: ABC transporter permease [Vicinamibacterales bacterium]
MFSDLRFGARMLARTPATSVAAFLALALGIGANTTIFSVVYGVLLRPLPYDDPDRIIMVWQDLRKRGGPSDEWATPGNYVDWKAETSVFESLAVGLGTAAILTDGGDAEQVPAGVVSAAYFDVFGARPALGRLFTAAEEDPNAPRKVILSDTLWRRRFGGDRSILGRTIGINDQPHEVVGVMARGFQPPLVAPLAQLWQPVRINAASPSRGAVVLRAFAKLRDGVGLEQAASHMETVAARLERLHPENRDAGIRLEPLYDQLVGTARPAILVLAGAVGLVLLIACANVANLLLARASARGREMAVRTALGAGRVRLVRQLLAESLLLAAIGGCLGVLLAMWGVGALVAASPAGFPRVDTIGVNWAVLAFTLAITLATGLVFGLAPALHASRADLSAGLREGGRGQAGGGGRTLRRLLVVAETALALVLLAGAGLLLRSFVHLQAVDRGFHSSNVIVGGVAPPRARFEGPDTIVSLYDRLVERLRAVPGAESSALVSVLPLSGSNTDMSFQIEGRPAPASPTEQPVAWYRIVSSDYFKTMKIRIVQGRGLTDQDTATAPGSAVINEALARKYWRGGDPLGRRISAGDTVFTIVGIVSDIRHRGPGRPADAELYVHYRQFPERGMTVVVRGAAAGRVASLAPSVREAVRSVDPALPLANVGTMEELEAAAVAEPRFVMLLAGLFAAIALTLALVGVYGVLSFAVAQRTSEIGVRMALGATRADVLGLVVGDGLRMVGLGAIIGVAGAAVAGRAMRTLLFGVHAVDPLTLGVTVALLVAAAAIACAAPARRATRIDPVEALRYE